MLLEENSPCEVDPPNASRCTRGPNSRNECSLAKCEKLERICTPRPHRVGCLGLEQQETTEGISQARLQCDPADCSAEIDRHSGRLQFDCHRNGTPSFVIARSSGASV